MKEPKEVDPDIVVDVIIAIWVWHLLFSLFAIFYVFCWFLCVLRNIAAGAVHKVAALASTCIYWLMNKLFGVED